MTDIGFYQLAVKPLATVLSKLLEKAVAAGHRVVVRSGDPAQLAALDAALWTYEPAAFLPHAVDGDAAADQPVLLTGGEAAPNGADVAAVIDGRLPDPAAFKRILYLFDGGDTDASDLARRHWKTLKGRNDVTPVFWQENERGAWVKAG